MAHRPERDGNVGGCTKARLSASNQTSQCVVRAAKDMNTRLVTDPVANSSVLYSKLSIALSFS